MPSKSLPDPAGKGDSRRVNPLVAAAKAAGTYENIGYVNPEGAQRSER